MERSNEEMLGLLRKYDEEEGKVTQNGLDDHEDYPHSYHFKKSFGTLTNAKREAGVRIGSTHLTNEKLEELQERIDTDQELRDMLIGLLMSDASLRLRDKKTCSMQIEMKNEEFIRWLDQELGNISSGVSVRERTINGSEWTHYVVSTKALPFFDDLSEWYSSGNKIFPSDLTLTPTMAKYWYVGDGSLVTSTERPYCVIYSANESKNGDKLEAYFEDTPFDPNYHTGGGGVLQFSRDETKELLDWMGNPPPGFDYKWQTTE